MPGGGFRDWYEREGSGAGPWTLLSLAQAAELLAGADFPGRRDRAGRWETCTSGLNAFVLHRPGQRPPPLRRMGPLPGRSAGVRFSRAWPKGTVRAVGSLPPRWPPWLPERAGSRPPAPQGKPVQDVTRSCTRPDRSSPRLLVSDAEAVSTQAISQSTGCWAASGGPDRFIVGSAPHAGHSARSV